MLPEAERVEWVLGISDDIKKQQLMLHLGETQRRQLIDSFGLEEHEAQAIPRRIQNPLSTAYQSGVDGKNKPSAGGETLKKLAKKKFDIDEKLDKSLTSAFALRGNDETVLAQNGRTSFKLLCFVFCFFFDNITLPFLYIDYHIENIYFYYDCYLFLMYMHRIIYQTRKRR